LVTAVRQNTRIIWRDIKRIKRIRLTKVIEYFYYRNGQKVYKTVVFYLAKTNTKEVRLSYEHKGYAWLSYEEAIKRVTYKSSKKVLEKAHRYLLAIGEITK